MGRHTPLRLPTTVIAMACPTFLNLTDIILGGPETSNKSNLVFSQDPQRVNHPRSVVSQIQRFHYIDSLDRVCRL